MLQKALASDKRVGHYSEKWWMEAEDGLVAEMAIFDRAEVCRDDSVWLPV